MTVFLRYIFLAAPLLMLIACQPKQEGKWMQEKMAHLYAQPDTLHIAITLDTAVKHPINPGLLGFNTAFTYGSGVEHQPGFDTLLRAIGPKVLRFPGGTVANFYHPGGNGYGFVRREMGSIKAFSSLWQYQQKSTENILVPFAQMAKRQGSSVLFVANLVTGTPEEAIEVLDHFASQGVAVAGVELGNELYFRRYRQHFPDVGAYIATARNFAEVIRAKYPGIPLIVCAPGKMEDGMHGRQPAFFDEWNRQLAEENFYDAYTIHTYFDLKMCGESKGALRRFGCIYERLTTDIPVQIQELVRYMQGIYGKDRPLYITEWNLNPPGVWSNSFVHGAIVSYMLMGMATEPAIVAGAYHNLAAVSDNYALLFNDNGTPAITAAYRVFRDYQLLVRHRAERIGAQVEQQDGPSPYITVWQAEGGQKLWLWYVNPHGHPLSMEIPGISPSLAILRCHAAKNFLTGRRGDAAGKDGQLLQREYPLNVRNFAVPPFSWGIIVVEL